MPDFWKCQFFSVPDFLNTGFLRMPRFFQVRDFFQCRIFINSWFLKVPDICECLDFFSTIFLKVLDIFTARFFKHRFLKIPDFFKCRIFEIAGFYKRARIFFSKTRCKSKGPERTCLETWYKKFRILIFFCLRQKSPVLSTNFFNKHYWSFI